MITKRINLALAAFLFLALLSGFMPALRVQADVYFDSLYAEIEAANSSGSGNITLTADVTLSAALPPITGTITIEGDGNTISGANAYRIFDVDGGDLTIRNITLTEGKSDSDGGAILIEKGANLVIENVTFNNNVAKHGGAISTREFFGSLSVSDSVFDGNSAGTGGGAILVNGGTATITGSAFVNNKQSPGAVLSKL